MRIGVITLPLFTNYGGILQAYALQHVLRQMGHSVETTQFQWKLERPFMKEPLRHVKHFVLRHLFQKDVNLDFQRKKHFVEEYINLRQIRHYSDIQEGEYDALIVGSDQIWRPSYLNEPIEYAFLAFAKDWKDIKRLAYAVSFGTDQWEYNKEQTAHCCELIKLFDAVSVREESAVTMCKQFLHRDVQQMLDPTMLLTANDYAILFKNKPLQPIEGEMLVYILDENTKKLNVVTQMSNKLGYKPFQANSSYINRKDLQSEMQYPVEQWLKGFQDAQFVITDSFHGTVFSILFGKPFVVLGNEERGLARLKSLLKLFGLENHLMLQDGLAENGDDYSWDRQVVSQELDELRKDAYAFLTTHLVAGN